MNNQILRGAKIGNVVLQQDDARIEIVADFTDSVCESMDWSAPSMTQKTAGFEDQFGAGSFKITNDQKTMDGGTGEISVPFDSMGGFKIVRCKDKGQDSTRLELRFHVCTTDSGAVHLCQEYKRTAKKGTGQMKVKLGGGKTVTVKAAEEEKQGKLVEMPDEKEKPRRVKAELQ